MLTAGQDRRSVPQRGRTAAPALPATPPRRRSGQRRPAIRRGRQCAGRRRHIRLRQGQWRQSGRSERVAPRFPLTLRAMFGTRQVSPLAGPRSILALSMLALLALGCCPMLAQAEDSSGIQYNDAPPPVPGDTVPNGHQPPADSSQANGGKPGNGSGSSRGDSSVDDSSDSGGAAGAARGGGGDAQQGSQGKPSSNGSSDSGKAAAGSATPASSQEDGGSSPLIPILIAIAVLAAISVGVVVMRQRRRGDSSGSPVSPEAG